MKYADRVKDTSTTTGTGSFVLANATLAGFQSFASSFSIGDAVPYCVTDDYGNWEVGTGTLVSSTTLSRSPTSSSNAGGLVNFPAGSKTVICTLPASRIAKLAAADDTATTTIASSSTSTLLIEEGGVTKRISITNFLTALGQTATDLTSAGTLSGTDVFTCVQDGVNEVKTTLADIAAAVAAINGTTGGGTSAATAVTLTGPTSGSYNTASTNFTVGANGTITGTVTVTPSDGGAGGSFSPTSVAISSSSTTATFTYTPTTTGARTISVTNNGSLTNPTSITYTSNATVPGAPTIGTATAGDASVSVAFTAPTNTGGASITGYTVTAYKASDNSTVTTATGASSPINVTALTNGTAYYFKVAATNSVGTGAQSSASSNATPASGGTSYTIAGYSGNSTKTTQSSANFFNTFTSLGYFLPDNTTKGTFTTSSYWTISPTPPTDGTALAYSGWGTSSTVAPSVITQAANTAGASSVNGLTPMGHPGAFQANSNLWCSTTPGTYNFYHWVKPSDGAAYCTNPSAPLVVTVT